MTSASRARCRSHDAACLIARRRITDDMPGSIATQIIAGTLLFALTVALEACATIWVLEWRRGHLRRMMVRYSLTRGVAHITAIMVALLGMHLVQMSLWAAAFAAGGAADSIDQALSLSMLSFSTLGPTGPVPNGWELLAALEGVTGSMMMGWSAGILFVSAHSFYQSVLNRRPVETLI